MTYFDFFKKNKIKIDFFNKYFKKNTGDIYFCVDKMLFFFVDLLSVGSVTWVYGFLKIINWWIKKIDQNTEENS